MIKEIFKSFIKDKISLVFIFLLNSFMIILFFNLIHQDKLEVFYPLAICIFFFVLLMIVEWIRYYSFNKCLKKSIGNSIYNFKGKTCEQKKINKILNSAHEKYIQEINSIKGENENKTRFLSQWIHNLKTPVSVIDLIIQKCTTEKTDPFKSIESIKEENNRLYKSLEQVLNIIRLENFEKDYETSTIELIYTLKKIINSRKNQFILNNIFPKIICEFDEVNIISDSKWNEVMVDQIVSNAIKYSSGGQKSKNIYFTITKNKNNTILSIRDEGVGIPQWDIKRVFEPFFTGENGRKFRDSTGIGLYVCDQIGKKLGQEIDIKSDVGQGTEVTITYLSKL